MRVLLGEGNIYCDIVDDCIKLTTDDKGNVYNTIYLSPVVWSNLIIHISKLQKIIDYLYAKHLCYMFNINWM